MKELVLPETPKFQVSQKNYGKVIIEPLERGYGTTIGNSLRRILLSSIEGGAVTAIRIPGISHEFSTIKGVKEDVIHIIMNLKKIRFKVFSDTYQILKLNAEGPAQLKASNIQTTPDVEILTPDIHIATLSHATKFNMEIEVAKGRGYHTAEQNKRPEHPLNTIPIDSLFSPIYKVNYEVETTRYKHTIDYDRLIMEIWTDGSILPEDALIYSATTLQKMLDIFIPSKQKPKEPILLPKTEEEIRIEKIREFVNQSLKNLQLSTRPYNALTKAGITTIRELVEKTPEELRQIKNFGKECLIEIQDRLSEIGITLGQKIP